MFIEQMDSTTSERNRESLRQTNETETKEAKKTNMIRNFQTFLTIEHWLALVSWRLLCGG